MIRILFKVKKPPLVTRKNTSLGNTIKGKIVPPSLVIR